MQYILLLLGMIFCHIVDDYYLQGWLAQAKQREWWKKNAPESLYENDYIMALMEHALSWTIMIHIPVIIFLYFNNMLENVTFIFSILFSMNWMVHTIVDDMKANKKIINLVQDQCIHFIQIGLTWFIYILGHLITIR